MPNPEDGVPLSDPKKSCLKHPHGGKEEAPRKTGITGVTQPGRGVAAATGQSTLRVRVEMLFISP